MMFVSVLHDNSQELVGVNAATLGQVVLQHPFGGLHGNLSLAIGMMVVCTTGLVVHIRLII